VIAVGQAPPGPFKARGAASSLTTKAAAMRGAQDAPMAAGQVMVMPLKNSSMCLSIRLMSSGRSASTGPE
jgi:hypothetical protein